jgi:superfamily II DNA/RNA helicase
MSFANLGLSDALLKAVADSGYTEPTPIQRQAIPAVLMGRDLLGIAQTGTGKTAGFTLPMIDILAEGRARTRMPRSLILEPTRELAAQVAETFDRYGKYHKLTKVLLIGGVAFGDQDKALERGVDVLIATPGRLLDQFERGKILLSGLEMLVIDEADRMLDMGFIPDVERICSLIHGKRQTLFFSATMQPPIKKLADKFLNDPKVVEVARQATTGENITQYLVAVTDRTKVETLRGLLMAGNVQNAIIFCNRKKDVKSLYDSLKRHKMNVAQLHGDMEQSERNSVLEEFRKSDTQILVASDVAARGLDVPAVSHVFNYDVPFNAEDYVHRIGRTGRAGRAGTSYTFATPRDAEAVADVEKLIGKPIPRLDSAHAVNATPAGPEAKTAATTARPEAKPRRRAGKTSSKAAATEPVAEHEARPAAAEPEAAKVAAVKRDAVKPETGRARRDPSKPQKSRRFESDDDQSGSLEDHMPAFLKVSARI